MALEVLRIKLQKEDQTSGQTYGFNINLGTVRSFVVSKAIGVGEITLGGERHYLGKYILRSLTKEMDNESQSSGRKPEEYVVMTAKKREHSKKEGVVSCSECW